VRASIEKWIAEFLAGDDSRLEWLKAPVREHGFLPLYIGWLAVLGVRPDGSFVRYGTVDGTEPGVLRSLRDGFYQRLAVCEGAKRYAELRALLPSQPTTAVTCETCRGSGCIEALPTVICSCGGTGWVIPGETTTEEVG
jgi:hypothetical protein